MYFDFVFMELTVRAIRAYDELAVSSCRISDYFRIMREFFVVKIAERLFIVRFLHSEVVV